jgi:hypothetical protein
MYGTTYIVPEVKSDRAFARLMSCNCRWMEEPLESGIREGIRCERRAALGGEDIARVRVVLAQRRQHAELRLTHLACPTAT